MTQHHTRPRERNAWHRRTFEETLVRYDGAALRFGSGPLIGRCSALVAWRFLNEVGLFADHEIPALFAACVEGEARDLDPGGVRALASLLLEN